ncbi:(11Z)-hexadec-11-enoyl-CoA conjugase-like [Zerene cesonia]|uniref:(11Z)-hexadec-11-enoyl-CoA conjugase-like n=1 Tax=Zerene cesonia TaxID=33412 RepID=UPI0018E4ECBD|nr:(11Z)-hexadec-11-enoyl-CoA conjugase-like [Zerene cesonia]
MEDFKPFEGRKPDDPERKNKEDFYDKLLPKESKLWAPIRRWEKRMGYLTPIIWFNVGFIFSLHAITIAYVYYFFASGNRIKLQTWLIGFAYYTLSGFGLTAGIHRCWSHRAFKAKLPVKILMLIGYAACGQIPIYNWVRDHRIHHKMTETTSDPHDATRGFFFSHVGWLLMKKHPHVLAAGAKLDMSDITSDPWLVYFDKHFTLIKTIWCYVVPTLLPMWFAGETFSAAIVVTMIRFMLILHGTWSVNSFAHLYGARPYNKNIKATNNHGVSLITLGEGAHNFHHTFPWDYKSTENTLFSFTTIILNVFAWLGLVYDAKVASASLIKKTCDRLGERSSRKLLTS